MTDEDHNAIFKLRNDNPCFSLNRSIEKIKECLKIFNITYETNVVYESCEFCYDNSVRPFDRLYMMSLLNILNKTGTAMSISQTPIIGIKTGNSVLVVDGKHRLEAIRIHNLEGHGKKICFPDGLLGFFIYGQLEHHQKLTLISLAEDSVRDKKYPLTKIEIMRNSRIMLRNCPKVLGLAPLPKNGHTDYQDKSKCVTAIIDFFHVFPADLVLRNIWKTSRISDEHSEEIFKLFQTLPSGFDVNDYDVLFNKYSCAPDKVFYILRPSENNRFRKLNDIREQLKRVEKEFIPLLKDYGAYDKNLDEHEHFTHISANIRGGLAETEKTKSILVAYVSSKTRNLCRYKCPQEKLEFLQRRFEIWYDENSKKFEECQVYLDSNKTMLKDNILPINDFHGYEWYEEFVKPHLDNGDTATAALCVYAEVQRLQYKKKLPDCYKFYKKYLKKDKTFAFEKLLSKINKKKEEEKKPDDDSELDTSLVTLKNERKRHQIDDNNDLKISKISKNVQNMQETSTNDIIIYDGKVQKTPQELLNCPHQIITYKRPKELWLRNICEEFELPFSKTIFASDEPVDDIYYWCPDEVIKTESNGHCGFMSFSTILTGSPDHHGKIRTMIANHIIRSFDMVGGLIIFLFDKNPWGKNALEYANEDLEVDPNIPTHHWMRSLHLAAAADLFQCNVLVKRSDAHGWNCYNTMTYVHGIEKMEYISTLPSILIDNHSGNHFEPIITLKRIL